jgi:hypothetical protein
VCLCPLSLLNYQYGIHKNPAQGKGQSNCVFTPRERNSPSRPHYLTQRMRRDRAAVAAACARRTRARHDARARIWSSRVPHLPHLIAAPDALSQHLRNPRGPHLMLGASGPRPPWRCMVPALPFMDRQVRPASRDCSASAPCPNPRRCSGQAQSRAGSEQPLPDATIKCSCPHASITLQPGPALWRLVNANRTMRPCPIGIIASMLRNGIHGLMKSMRTLGKMGRSSKRHPDHSFRNTFQKGWRSQNSYGSSRA